MRRTKRKNKNALIAVLLLLIIALLAAGRTIAWLTKTSSISNTFTVGTFTTPKTDPKDPTKTINIDGNLYEPSWDSKAEHKLVPAASFSKDPYVGIGPGSEDAVVYVYVKNTLSNKVYFTLNEGWEAVSGHVTAGFAENTYTSGLFRYTAGLTASNSDTVWTSKPIFNQIVTDNEATAQDFTAKQGEDLEIVVTSFLHQAKDSTGATISIQDVIEPAAIATLE